MSDETDQFLPIWCGSENSDPTLALEENQNAQLIIPSNTPRFILNFWAWRYINDASTENVPKKSRALATSKAAVMSTTRNHRIMTWQVESGTGVGIWSRTRSCPLGYKTTTSSSIGTGTKSNFRLITIIHVSYSQNLLN